MAKDTPTIFDWGGGTEAFTRWLNAFYDLVEGSALLRDLFGGRVTEAHRDHVVAWWSEVRLHSQFGATYLYQTSGKTEQRRRPRRRLSA
jgi:truncated hemoglobin YjbI